MSTDMQSITFNELLTLNEAETERWKRWFGQQPSATLDLPVTIAGSGTVRGLLLHIFAVELRHTERLQEQPSITAYESLAAESAEALFRIGERARIALRLYLDSATDLDLSRVIQIHTRSAGVINSTKRKLVAHIFFHGIRHWAQLATALRQSGFTTDWPHDVVFAGSFQ